MLEKALLAEALWDEVSEAFVLSRELAQPLLSLVEQGEYLDHCRSMVESQIIRVTVRCLVQWACWSI